MRSQQNLELMGTQSTTKLWVVLDQSTASAIERRMFE